MKRAAAVLWLAAAMLEAQVVVVPSGPGGMPGPTLGDSNKAVGAKPGEASPTKPASPSAVRPNAAAAARPPASAAGAVPSYKDLKFPTLRPIQLPPIDASTLPNGMRLLLLEDHELPLVNGMALVRTGSLLDPADKVGLAAMAATVMRTGGAGKATGDQLSERLADDGGAVETTVTTNSTSVTFNALKETTPDVLAVFKDVLTAPRFSEENLDLVRTQMQNSIAHRNDDPTRLVHRELSDTLYGRDNPFGREQQTAAIGNLQRSDLVAFHTRYFFPKNTILAIRGDFDSAAMKTQIEKLFADWTVDQPAPRPFPKVTGPPAGTAGIYLAVKRVAQTTFAMGQIGGTLNDKDYAALTILADILGGSRGRIWQRLRSRGAGNAVSVRWDAGYDYPGLFEIAGSLPSLSAVEGLKAIEDEVGRIRTAEVSDEELRASKESVINAMVFNFDTEAKTLGRVVGYQYYGYPADFIDQYQKALAAVTRADVLRVAKERLQPESFATVLVGDPADFMPPLESLGRPVHKLELAAAPEPKMATAKVDASSTERGKALLARMQKAIGGLDRLAAIQDSITVADYQVSANGKITPVRHTERWIAPMHYREDNELGGGVISSYFDGSFGWITVPGGSAPLIGPNLKQLQGNAFRQYALLLQGGKYPDGTVNAIDDLTLEISAGGESARVQLDPDSGMPVRIRYEAVAASGPPLLAEEIWSDFRAVGGIQFPYKVTILENGKKYADVTIADFRVNTGLKVSDLDKRP